MSGGTTSPTGANAFEYNDAIYFAKAPGDAPGPYGGSVDPPPDANNDNSGSLPRVA